MAKIIQIYYDVNGNIAYKNDMTEIGNNNTPQLTLDEAVIFDIQLLNSADKSDICTHFANTTASAIIDDNFNHFIKSTIINIDDKILTTKNTADFVAQTGRLQLINSSNQSEIVEYESFIFENGNLIFTLKNTPTYNYANDDVCNINDVPLMRATTINTSNNANGNFQATIFANSLKLSKKLADKSKLENCYFELQILNTAAERVLILEFEVNVKNIRDYCEAIPPADEANFYNKVQVNALLNLPFDLQFSVDGVNDWHDEQNSNDRFYHQRKQNSTGDWGGSTKLIQGNQGLKGDQGNPFVYTDFTAEQLENLKINRNFLHNGEGIISQRGATSTASNTPRFIDDRFYYLPINPTATIEATNAGTGEISVVCSDGNFICRQPQTAKDIYYIFGQHFTMFSEANNILTHKIILIKNDDTEEIINGVTNSDGSTTFDLTAKNTADFQTVYFDFTSTTPTANIKYRHANIGENFTGKDYKNRTLELLNCQPYYFQIHFTRAIALSSFSVANGGNASSFPVYFPTEMRTTPTFHTGMWQYYDGSNFVDSSTIHSQVYDNKMTLFRVTSHNNENKMILPKMNEDGILSFDAEIIDGS